MIAIDKRFHPAEIEMLRACCGADFIKYRCDPFVVTNSVYLNVGLYIGQKVYRLSNEIEPLDYYGTPEDVAVLKIYECSDHDIKSGLMGIEQIDTPIGEKITAIKIVNEHQMLFCQTGEQLYDVWLTRGIIFVLPDREISFEKEIWFSEDINICRGYNLIETFASADRFLEDWPEDVRAACDREITLIHI